MHTFAKGRAGRPLATHSQRRAVALALAAGAGASQAREAARRLAPLARSPLRACPCGTTIRASSSYCGTGRRAHSGLEGASIGKKFISC